MHSKPNENCRKDGKDKIRNKPFRITENNILIREHPCFLIDSGDMYANSIRKITSVLISILM